MGKNLKNIIIIIITSCFFLSGLIGFLLIPDKLYSASERRKLAELPELTFNSVKNGKFMNNFENYSMDQFPFREKFRSIKSFAVTDLMNLKDKDKLYSYNDFLVKMDYPLNKESIKYATDRFDFIKENYLKNNKIYVSVIPDKNIYLGKKSSHLFIDFQKMENEIKKNMPYAKYINIKDLLDENSFYKTDTHFKQDKIIKAAQKITNAMGHEADDKYDIVNTGKKFYGVYYGQYSKDVEADSISYLMNDTVNNMKVYDGENNKITDVYNMDKLDEKDPYEMFLSGPLSLVTISNPLSRNNDKLIIFRDSFGSSIAPVIATAYKETVLVDIRYISPLYIDKFVSFYNADILFLYSSIVLNNSNTLK